MRGFCRTLLAVSPALLCLAAHAEISLPPVSSATSLPVQGAASLPRYSMALQTDEIAVLFRHLEGQHVYLKHLENMRSAVERELSIVRLMSECERLGSSCTGKGIARKIVIPGKPGDEEEAPLPSPPSSPPSSSPPLPEAELPEVVAVYHGTASLLYRQRYVEVRRGERFGPFTVRAVGIDGVRLDGPRGRVFLSPRWSAPEAAQGFPSSVYRGPGGANRHAR